MRYLSAPDLSWLNLKWFAWSTLQDFQWEYPDFLYGLALVPLLFVLRWLLAYRFRPKLEVATFDARLRWQPSSLLRFLPDAVQMLFMALIVVALARPQMASEKIEQFAEGIDIMLLLDVSGSMDLKDLKPDRLEAAKEVAVSFVAARSQDRIGVIVFAGEAFSLLPLTTDQSLLIKTIRSIGSGMISSDGTAIGSALAVATNRLSDSESKSKVAILISDGENTAGNLDPTTAAQLAYAFGIKLYTIGVGQDGKVLYEEDELGMPSYVETRLDEQTLRDIARIGKGEFYRATSNNALSDIMQQIDKLEKTEIKETHFKDTRDFYHVYLAWAIVFLLVWLLLKNSFMANALED